MRTPAGWIVGIVVALAVGCGTVTAPSDGDVTPELVSITITQSGAGAGRVVSSPAGIDCGATCTMMVEAGTQITLTPEPTASSAFAGWTGGGCTAVGPCTLTATADVTLTARFVEQRTLTVAKAGSGGGAVTSAPAGIDCGADCTQAYEPNTSITLTATAASGSAFLGWSGGGCTGTATTCVVAITADTTVTATFGLDQSLSVMLAGSGMGKVTSAPAGIDCGVDCNEIYTSGTMVTLTATPIGDAVFSGWSGDCTTSTGPCVVTVDQARAVTATFTQNQYVLTVAPTGNGAGVIKSTGVVGIDCGADCTEPFDSGMMVTLTATPATGSTFTGWNGGGCTGTSTCTTTITAAVTVTAAFTLTTHLLTVATSGGNGTGTVTASGINCVNNAVDCTQSYNYGTSVTLTATPATGSTFAGWTGGGCLTTNPCTTTITAADTVTAIFTLTTHTLTVSKTGTGAAGGTVTATGINCGVDCTEVVNYGTVITLTATPTNPNLTLFEGWTGGGCTGVGTCTTTITAATAVSAKFTSIIRATWDPVFAPAATYGVGNLAISGNAVATQNGRTTIGKSSGKWYWEVTVTAGSASVNGGGLGILEAVMPPSAQFVGQVASGVSFGYGPATAYYASWAGTTLTAGVAPATSALETGRTFMFALDMDAGRWWAGAGGVWFNGGNPITGTSPIMSGLTGTVFPGVTLYANSGTAVTANFGASAFTYAVPTGFNAGLYSLPTTWDPAWSVAGVVYAPGNLGASGNSPGTKNARTTIGKSSGKWYWEVAVSTGVSTTNGGGLGIAGAAMPATASYIGAPDGAPGLSFGYGPGNSQYYTTWPGVTVTGTPPANTAINAGTIYMFALDLTTGRLYIGQNGVWFGSGDPAANANPIASGLTGVIHAALTFYASSPNALTANFGASAFTYARPQGYAPLL